jgi:hypothetical protein
MMRLTRCAQTRKRGVPTGFMSHSPMHRYGGTMQLDRRGLLRAVALAVVAASARIPAAHADVGRWALPAARVPAPAGVLTRLPGTGSQLALTIDDGTNTEVVAAFAQFCRDSGTRLTFFVNGVNPSWRLNADALRPMVDSGQIQLGNHTWSHPNITRLSTSDLTDQIRRNKDFLVNTYGVDGTPYFAHPMVGTTATPTRATRPSLCGAQPSATADPSTKPTSSPPPPPSRSPHNKSSSATPTCRPSPIPMTSCSASSRSQLTNCHPGRRLQLTGLRISPRGLAIIGERRRRPVQDRGGKSAPNPAGLDADALRAAATISVPQRSWSPRSLHRLDATRVTSAGGSRNGVTARMSHLVRFSATWHYRQRLRRKQMQRNAQTPAMRISTAG